MVYGQQANPQPQPSQPTYTNTNIYDPKPKNLYESPEDGIKRVLIEEIMNSTERKIMEEIKKIKLQEEKLKSYNSDFNSQMEKYLKVINNSDNISIDFQNMLKTCENEINSIKNYLSENSSKEINSKNFENFIQIANQKILRIVSVEAAIDDFRRIL